ncbi:hypothetical protein D3C72_1213790 [compost metagenome]
MFIQRLADVAYLGDVIGDTGDILVGHSGAIAGAIVNGADLASHRDAGDDAGARVVIDCESGGLSHALNDARANGGVGDRLRGGGPGHNGQDYHHGGQNHASVMFDARNRVLEKTRHKFVPRHALRRSASRSSLTTTKLIQRVAYHHSLNRGMSVNLTVLRRTDMLQPQASSRARLFR